MVGEVLSWSLRWGEGGEDPGVVLGGWLRQSTHPFDGVVCRDHAPYPAFAPDTSEVAVGFLVFL